MLLSLLTLTLASALAAAAPQPPATSPAASPAAPSAAAPEKPAPDGPTVSIETSMGEIRIRLHATLAPLSTKNFLAYVRANAFDGTIFHRVMPTFMIQGGGLDAKMVEKPTNAPVKNESKNGLSNLRGTVALARTGEPHSATNQFFINVKDNHGLDFGIARDGWGYAVFAEVVSGMEVVDAIRMVPTTSKFPHQNVPITPVVITRVRVVPDAAKKD